MSTSVAHVVASTAPHTHTIIFLHGHDSNAREFASEFFESQASDDRFLTDIFPGYKWVFPCAAIRYVEMEQEEMHQWFDMASVREPNRRPEIQLEGLRESVQGIWDIIRREAEEVSGYEKVFLAGISQGCAAAIVALLTGKQQLAGFIGMSSWLPFPPASSLASPKVDFVRWLQESLRLTYAKGIPLESSELEATLQVPVLLEHACDDEVVPIGNGKRLYEGLRELGMEVEWQEYGDGGHWINEPRGIDDMVRFMKRCG
jgi:lysophospholipase-2